MKVSRVLSGFSAVEANKLRKAAGKKQTDLMKSLHERFIEGARPRIESGETTVEEVEDIWSRIETFGNYGFCAAHATAYGAISCIEMWLKYHFPVEYICALLNNTKLGKKSSGSADELVAFINYARRNGIEVLGPDINKSSTEFTIEDGKIRFSLSHIKNVAKDAKTIVQFQPFADIADFHERVKSSPKDEEEEVDTEDASPVTDEADESPLPDEEMKKILLEEMAKMGKKVAGRRPNKKKIESLVAAGAFDCFGKRNDVVQAYYGLRKKPVKKPRKAKVVAEGEEVKPKKAAEEAPQYTDSQWIELEKEMIGLCLSQPPLYKVYEPTIRKEKWKLVSELPATTNKKVYVFGQIVSIRSHTSQKGNQMYIVNLTDGLDDMKFFVFQGGQQFFRDNYRAGSIGAIPLSKFDEGDTRFFDDNRECIVLQK
jgi:DNA polymerase-3 subunit alpha